MAELAALPTEEGLPKHSLTTGSWSGQAARRPGRPEAAAAIWDWRRAGAREHSARQRGQARLHGSIQALVGAALGVLIFLFWSRTLAAIVWGIALLTLGAALLSPERAYAAIRRVIGLVANSIGIGMGWVLLTPLYYLFFVPFGLLFRHGRADRLERFFDNEAPTYWKHRRVESFSPSDYDRQF